MSRLPTNEEYELFTRICKLKDGAVMKLMGKVLREYYPKSSVISTQDYVYAQGTIPIGLIAHADTVHTMLPNEIFHDKEKNVVWSPEGIGADDRAGIYAIIDIIRDGYRPTVIICNEEEIGGQGARKFVKAFPEPLSKINFLLEMDRMGFNDMVFYSCDNPEFEAYLKPYGFETDWGSFSDIAVIAPAWKVAAANLSIGYEDEHTKAERLYFNWMFETIRKVKNILEDEMVEDHPFIFIEGYDYGYRFYDSKYDDLMRKYGYGYDYEDSIDDYGCTPVKHAAARDVCDFCGQVVSSKDVVNIFEMGQWFHICKKCADETTAICKKCGKRFFTQSEKDDTCLNCRRIPDNGAMAN